jgi:hypothetical protein
MSFNYDKYTSGDYVKFDEVGDSVTGIIKEIREGRDFNGNPCPLITLEVSEEGDEKTLTAGQVLLKAALAEKAPQVGDKIRITYSGVGEAKPGKAPAKVFTVDVKPGPHELVVPAPVLADDAPF